MTALTMTEADLQRAVMDLCRLYRCLVHHCRPAQTGRGWRTPIQGDAGFPDLVILGSRGLLLRELKTDRGGVSPGQAIWANRALVAGVDHGVWRPADLASGRIAAQIRGIC